MEGLSGTLPGPGGASYCSEGEEPSASEGGAGVGGPDPWLMGWQSHEDWTTGKSGHRAGCPQPETGGWGGMVRSADS